MSPSVLGQVGSPTIALSHVSPLAAAHASSFTVPLTAGPSSSPVISSETAPLGAPCLSTQRANAATKQAIPPFMPTAPPPSSTPYWTTPAKGGYAHQGASPGGTTPASPATI